MIYHFSVSKLVQNLIEEFGSISAVQGLINLGMCFAYEFDLRVLLGNLNASYVFVKNCFMCRDELLKQQTSSWGLHKMSTILQTTFSHDDVIKWKHFPCYWPFCVGNAPVTGEFPAQRPVTRSFGVFFDLHLNGWVNNREAGDLRRHHAHLWRHCNEMHFTQRKCMYVKVNFTELVPNGSVDNNSALVQVTAWHQIGDKPLPEPMITQCTNTIWLYQVTMRLARRIPHSSGPFYKHGLTLIPAWISNHIHFKMWNEITYPFLNFNGATVEV